MARATVVWARFCIMFTQIVVLIGLIYTILAVFNCQLDKRLAAMKDITQAVERANQADLLEATSRLPPSTSRSALPDLVDWLIRNQVRLRLF
jgi:hypothetical protein